MVAARLCWSLLAALALGGCQYTSIPDPSLSARDAGYLALVPQVAKGDLNFERYQVEDTTGQPPGTVVVDSKQNMLWFVLPDKQAIRYGVSTGRDAYGWTGTDTIRRGAEWPRWMPPADMVQRWPHLAPVVKAGGLDGGPENPLGARALYLYDASGHDTLYRIHGTNEAEQIGRGVSSGCIRMRNIDVIDLSRRITVGTRVVVL